MIRSKETERETDWHDVALLEEILDWRNLANAVDESSIVVALSQLRSRRGFRRAIAEGRLQPRAIEQAFSHAKSPITRAFLRPGLSKAGVSVFDGGIIGEILSGPLAAERLGSDRHLALVEAVRRLYKQAAIAADRADKLRIQTERP